MTFREKYGITPSIVARFWKHVDRRGPDECWPWTGHCGRDGYGRFSPHTWNDPSFPRLTLASRMAHGVSTNEDPECVCHHCDNPPCCNPAHLFGGTQLDNQRDKAAKGRGRKPKEGTRTWKIRNGIPTNTRRVLDDAARRDIAACYGPSCTLSLLAARYNAAPSVIARVLEEMGIKRTNKRGRKPGQKNRPKTQEAAK